MIETITIICLLAAVITAMIYSMRSKIKCVASDTTVLVVNDIRFIHREGVIVNITYNDNSSQKFDFKTEENAIKWINIIIKTFN